MAKAINNGDIEARRAEWLQNYPDRFLACRTGHAFPKPKADKRNKKQMKLPNTRMEPWHDPDGRLQGCVYVEQSCGNCGRIRWKITGPRGSYYTDSTKWHYSDPKGYASPAGLGLTYADYAELYWTRLIDGDQYTIAAVEEAEEAR